ncbi:unnamed protein product [Gordionus sp. m RMFG-2023]
MYLWVSILIVLKCFSGILCESAFQIVWNSPTQVCKFRYNNDLRLASYGILTNSNETLRGQIISLFFDTQSGAWPSIVLNATTNTTVELNGGIPQKGNISNHLAQLEMNINTLMPDLNFNV